MAQITRPAPGTSQSQANISIGVAASAGEGAAAMGRAVVNFAGQYEDAGRQQLQAAKETANSYLAIEDMNKEALKEKARAEKDALQAKAMYEKGIQAERDAVVSNKLTEATTLYLGHRAVRESQVIDKNGNPTSGTLVSDLLETGNALKESIASTITDPTAAAAFRQDFDAYMIKQSTSAYVKANEQQVQFAAKSLDMTLDSLLKQAAKDDITQVLSYENQAVKALDNAVISGLITAQERDSKVGEYTTALREAAIEHTVRTDRKNGELIYNTSADSLGITAAKKDHFDDLYSAAVEEDERRVNEAYERQTIDQKADQAALYEDAMLRSQTGQLRKDDVVALQGKISPAKYKKLEETFVSDQGKRQAEMKFLNGIGDAITEGKSLNNYSDKELSTFYEYTVRKYQDQEGRPATLAEKARLANTLPVPVDGFQKDMEGRILNSNFKDAQELLEAYTYVQDTKSKALNSMDKKAVSIMEHTKFLVTRGGYTPETAYKKTMENLENATLESTQTNNKNWAKEDVFKSDALAQTVVEALHGVTLSEGQDLRTLREYIDPEVMSTFTQLAKENYSQFGDKDIAIEYATSLMKRSHAPTSVGTAQDLPNRYMFAPPEVFYGDQMSSQEMTKILSEDVTPQLPEGANPNSLTIRSSDATIRGYFDPETGERVKVPTWMVEYEDANGNRNVLMDHKSMKPILWSPVPTPAPRAKTRPANATIEPNVDIDTPITPDGVIQ